MSICEPCFKRRSVHSGRSSARQWARLPVTVFINCEDISSLLLLSISHFRDKGVSGRGWRKSSCSERNSSQL